MSNITDMNGNPVETENEDPGFDKYAIILNDDTVEHFEGLISLSDTWLAVVQDSNTLVYACPISNVSRVINLSAQ